MYPVARMTTARIMKELRLLEGQALDNELTWRRRLMLDRLNYLNQQAFKRIKARHAKEQRA
jgi:hypothetical protein